MNGLNLCFYATPEPATSTAEMTSILLMINTVRTICSVYANTSIKIALFLNMLSINLYCNSDKGITTSFIFRILAEPSNLLGRDQTLY